MRSLNLRLPDDLHAAIKRLAVKENRSLNSQILHVLKLYAEEVSKVAKKEEKREAQG